MNETETLYFVGIAGIGVSALAQIAQARGHRIVGADPAADPETVPAIARLKAGGATIYRTHSAENLPEDCTLLIYTAAARNGNPEMEEAKRLGIRTISRADYLGELMNSHPGKKIAVSGTHGKTTTTAMIGHLLKEALPPSQPPTVFVGAEVPQLGGNLLIGDPETPFVAEACEAYDSFLSLKPDTYVITNIEADHLDHYGDEAGVDNAFRKFLYDNPRPGSRIVACIDDPGVRRVVREAVPSPLFFSMTGNPEAEVQVVVFLTGSPSHFRIKFADQNETFVMPLPGRHNIANAVCAILAVREQGGDWDSIRKALNTFRGAERRLETLAEVNGITVLDDYAHHPTEIRATISALRAAHPDGRLTVVFQPHLFSRTRDFLPQFAEELSKADRLIVTDIYPAREAPIPGVTSESIVTLARKLAPSLTADYVGDKFTVPDLLLPTLEPGDLIVFMGAGDIREPGEILAQALGVGRWALNVEPEELPHTKTQRDEETKVEEHALKEGAASSAPYVGATQAMPSTQRPTSNARITLLMGGVSAEREVSLSGGKMVFEALDKTKFRVTAIDLRDLSDLLALRENKPDLVFPVLHGRGGEDGVVQGILDWLQIPYVGSGALASALAMNKVATKAVFAQNGIPVISGVTVTRARFTEHTATELLTRLTCPLFVKPNAEGSTFGATLVHLPETLQEALALALNYDDTVLIETYLTGTEITCGVLERTETGEPFALPVVEIVPKAEIYDYESKYAPGGSEHIIPARLSAKTLERVQTIAVECHKLLGCRDLSRTDFIVTHTKNGRDASESPYVLETNTLPGMTPTSLLPDAARSAGYSFAQLLEHLIASAQRRI